jgi:hypothetical protein
MRQLKSQKAKQYSHRVPDIETLKKKEEDKNFAQWETYLIKQRDILKA